MRLLGMAALFMVGCAAGGSNQTTEGTAATGSGGGGGNGVGGGVLATATSSSTSGSSSSSAGTGGGGGLPACAKFSDEAHQASAAMLIVLDRSASMSTNNKWGTAQLAVVNAVDADVFDSMSLGMSVFPSGYQPAPDCLCDGDPTCFGALPMGVACGAPTLPTVAISAAGTLKSSASTGVRHSIYDYLTGHSPETSDPSDSSPIYDSLVGGYAAIQALGSVDKRLLVLITDGGFSCTSVSTRSGISDGMCPDWEYPDAVNALITKARTDASKPVETFIVGVPGSDSTGEMQGPYATAPYHMRLALSTYAVSGSPDTVDPTCDKTATFSQTGADPAHPCHIDLSSGTAFNPTALAGAIKKIRGQSLGCVYDLPDPGAGQTVDKDQVNVLATIDGTQALVPKRKDSSDDCSTAPCWDYDANGKVAILGKECADLSAATMAKVDIYVGCDTIIK